MSRSLVLALALLLASASTAAAKQPPLWRVYNDSLKGAKYIDLTHTIRPDIPVWSGFGPATFAPAVSKIDGHTFTSAQAGFGAPRSLLHPDNSATHPDPPAHWAPEYAAIDEL